MLKITEQAQEAIRGICEEGGAGAEGGLRITGTTSEGGETELEFEVVEASVDGDDVVRQGDAVVFLDETASAILSDKTLDVHAHGDHFHFSIDEQ
jgi:Fe-S cluster assembly iron-binding protein IscA